MNSAEARRSPAHLLGAGDTKEALLDTAERLFAARGVAATSVRDITAEAAANLGAVNYHFGTKQELVAAVLRRRLGPLNDRRLALLDAIEGAAGGHPPAIETVLDALVRPAVEQCFVDGERNRAFMRLMGRCHSEPDADIERLIRTHFETVMTRFSAALSRAVEGGSRDELFWRLRFTMGALHHALLTGSKDEWLPAHLRKTLDADALIERLVSYAAAGMRARVSKAARADVPDHVA